MTPSEDRPTEDRSGEDQWSWRKTVPLLSLDAIRPFFGELGLKIPDVGEFQKLLRQAVAIAHPSPKSGQPAPEPEAWAADVGSRLRSRFDDGFAVNLGKWMHSVLLPPPDMPYNAWRLILSDLSRSPEKWAAAGFPPQHAEALRLLYRKLTDWSAITALAESARTHRLSEWDLAIYALYTYYDEANDPVAQASAAAKRQRLFTFWREMERTTTQEDRDRLLAGSREVAATKGMTLTLDLLRTGDWPAW